MKRQGKEAFPLTECWIRGEFPGKVEAGAVRLISNSVIVYTIQQKKRTITIDIICVFEDWGRIGWQLWGLNYNSMWSTFYCLVFSFFPKFFSVFFLINFSAQNIFMAVIRYLNCKYFIFFYYKRKIRKFMWMRLCFAVLFSFLFKRIESFGFGKLQQMSKIDKIVVIFFSLSMPIHYNITDYLFENVCFLLA